MALISNSQLRSFFFKLNFILVLGFAPAVFAGGSETHGGDIVIGEFMDLVDYLAEGINKVPVQLLMDEALGSKLENILTHLTVEVKPQVFFNGKEVLGINFKQDGRAFIHLSRALWNYKPQDESIYRRFALHELLPLLGVDDRDYRASSQLLPLIEFAQEGRVSEYILRIAKESVYNTMAIRQILSQSPAVVAGQADWLIYELSIFAQSISKNWERETYRLVNLLLLQIPYAAQRNNLLLECALVEVDKAALPWFFEASSRLRGFYPRPSCKL